MARLQVRLGKTSLRFRLRFRFRFRLKENKIWRGDIFTQQGLTTAWRPMEVSWRTEQVSCSLSRCVHQCSFLGFPKIPFHKLHWLSGPCGLTSSVDKHWGWKEYKSSCPRVRLFFISSLPFLLALSLSLRHLKFYFYSTFIISLSKGETIQFFIPSLLFRWHSHFPLRVRQFLIQFNSFTLITFPFTWE